MLGSENLSYLITPAKEGETYDIFVRAISYKGVKSLFVGANQKVYGKMLAPNPPTNLALDKTSLPLVSMEATDLLPAAAMYATRITWTPPTDLDLAGFDVKATATDEDEADNCSWRTVELLNASGSEAIAFTPDNSIVLYAAVDGFGGYVRVRSRDTSGNLSDWVRLGNIEPDNWAVSSIISASLPKTLLGRGSEVAGPIQRLATQESSLRVNDDGVDVVGQAYFHAGQTSTVGYIRFRDNEGATERSIDDGQTWEAVSSSGGGSIDMLTVWFFG
jgi:hypothetical protein